MEPKISVIVPVYNVEKYIHRCIDSILSQSFIDFELILVDDGSPDNCGKICDEYAQKDCRVRVFHKPNGGVSSARNLGLDNTKGKWITFIDSDDYIEIDYLEELVLFERDDKTDFVVTLNTIRKYTQCKSLTLQYSEYNQLFSLYGLDKNGYVIGKLYKTDIIQKLQLRFNTNVHLGEDVMFALKYLMHTNSIVIFSSDKYIYDKSRPDSLTKVSNSYDTELAGYHEIVRIVDLIIENLDLDNQSIYELECTKKFYIERTLSSIMKLPDRRDRLNKMRELDLSLYNKYTKPYNWKEKVLLFLLRKKFFYIYDMILHL